MTSHTQQIVQERARWCPWISTKTILSLVSLHCTSILIIFSSTYNCVQCRNLKKHQQNKWERYREMARNPPPDYVAPRFPSLNVKKLVDPTPEKKYTLYYISDVWRFTVLWTLIVYALFHLAAVLIAYFMHGWRKLLWKYAWLILIVYLVVAGVEAVLSATVVGLILGAVYKAGYYDMNTWIPCTWAFISVLILVISTFSIQGGL